MDGTGLAGARFFCVLEKIMLVATFAKRFAFAVVIAMGIVSFRLALAQTPSPGSRHARPGKSHHKRSDVVKKNRRVSYPFPWLKSGHVPVSVGSINFAVIDFKEFWDNLSPKDQQKYAHRSAKDYIKYVYDSMNPPAEVR